MKLKVYDTAVKIGVVMSMAAVIWCLQQTKQETIEIKDGAFAAEEFSDERDQRKNEDVSREPGNSWEKCENWNYKDGSWVYTSSQITTGFDIRINNAESASGEILEHGQ